MKTFFVFLMCCGLFINVGCRSATAPPTAEKKPKKLVAHDHVRIDDYFWLRERENPKVIAYLEKENAYTEAKMAPTMGLQEELFREMAARINPNDATVPVRKNGYFLYERFEEGKEYAIFCRKKETGNAKEEILLNVNELAVGENYFAVRGPEISPSNELMAYAYDTIGRRKYTIQIKNIESSKVLPDIVPNVTGDMAWANDNVRLLYTKQDPETLRPYQVWMHTLGLPVEQDRLVYEESDDTFTVALKKSKSDRYIFIISDQTLSTEYRVIDADKPEGAPTVLQPRERDMKYQVAHLEDRFVIRTNMNAKNFCLMQTHVNTPGRENWKPLVPHREHVFVKDFELFESHFVLTERRDGLSALRVMSWDGREDFDIAFDEPAYSVWVKDNPELDTPKMRYIYTSLTTPESTFEYDLFTRERRLLKEDAILGGFERSQYVTERHMVSAQDGTKIPLSLAYRKDFKKGAGNPALIYGYGSYGYSSEVRFKPELLSLLDRGFLYAIAHVRGGQEMGRQWYEDGKLLRKKNTFTDFNDCAEYLLKNDYAGKLFAMGGSAGGLLMGAIINMRPELYHGVVAAVPWVDVVTTMLDDTIPLTTSEYDEWGNPNDKQFYDYMLSYSPYDNVTAMDYPHLLVLTGLHDSQVQYWEPAKWVAKLRANKTDNNLLLLKTDMEAGHSGTTGRFKKYQEEALIYAFMLDLADAYP